MEHLNEKWIPIIVIFFIISWGIMVVRGYKNNEKKIAEYEQHTEKVYGNIQFKGKVLNVHKIDRWGRVYGIICIKLDYTNTNSFYRFDKMSCLKIKNNIATLPTGFIGNDEGYDKRVNAILSTAYIEVNIDNSKQIYFIDSLGNKFVQDYLYYRSSNLIESDLNRCNDCE